MGNRDRRIAMTQLNWKTGRFHVQWEALSQRNEMESDRGWFLMFSSDFCMCIPECVHLCTMYAFVHRDAHTDHTHAPIENGNPSFQSKIVLGRKTGWTNPRTWYRVGLLVWRFQAHCKKIPQDWAPCWSLPPCPQAGILEVLICFVWFLSWTSALNEESF